MELRKINDIKFLKSHKVNALSLTKSRISGVTTQSLDIKGDIKFFNSSNE